ncbi:unnamed protein product [Caenorhabditis angaria]|uniref:Uncharacterized protein n=1 Tax=Caenorhabditis angaria TaxID=860376 RepID=A0A9P1IDX9_9PELO|nr:unnamed protein product [Caenorhabditis angaria]
MSSTKNVDDEYVYQGIPTYWFIVIEVAYLIVCVVAAVVIRKLKFMKTDEDAVTSHHRFHDARIKKQEENLIEAQKGQENFLKGSPQVKSNV